MATFDKELAPDADRIDLVKKLIEYIRSRSGPGNAYFLEAARNLAEEENLGVGFWTAVADLAAGGGLAMPLPALEGRLMLIFQAHVRSGKPDVSSRKVYGRAIDPKLLVDGLCAGGRYPATAAASVVATLPLGSAADARRVLRSIPLGRYNLMWSTYCEERDDDDPFFERPVEALLIDDLGLEFRSGQEFLLLIYTLPPALDRFLPTVSDAYGGGFFFPFRTNQGRTHPIRYMRALKGRPEIVHEAVKGRNLAAAVERIRPDESAMVTTFP